jgi:AcrR family transcriptional regulator
LSSPSSTSDPHALSLRERKKLKTHLAIQREALRLFHEQGFDETTVEQIAAAAEVSPTTFFRYFPTKEDVVLHDVFDPLFYAAFEGQAPELSSVEAFRRTMHEVYGGLSAEDAAGELERQELIRSTPELWARALADLTTTLEQFAVAIARRSGRDAHDIEVLTLAGALMGAAIAIWLAQPIEAMEGFLGRFDAALAQLQEGLAL